MWAFLRLGEMKMGKEIRISSLIFHKKGTFIEVDAPLDEFFMRLSPKVGYAHFVLTGAIGR